MESCIANRKLKALNVKKNKFSQKLAYTRNHSITVSGQYALHKDVFHQSLVHYFPCNTMIQIFDQSVNVDKEKY